MKEKLALFIFILFTMSYAKASEPVSTCVTPAPKKPANPRMREPNIQEILVSCGNQSANQINLANQGTLPPASESKKDDQPFGIEIKLVEEIVKLIGSIAWPIAAITIGLFFKKELAALLARLKKGKWGDAEFEFEEQVREIEEETEITRTPDTESISPEAAARAGADPRGAIIGAWIEVESALAELVRRFQPMVSAEAATVGMNVRRRMSATSMIRIVQKAQALESEWISLFHDLRTLRNEAAHSVDFSTTPESAVTYVRLANELVNAIRKASDSYANA